jgi:hypothetical protein
LLVDLEPGADAATVTAVEGAVANSSVYTVKNS